VNVRAPTRLALTRVSDSWAWMRTDLAVRLLPFAGIYGTVLLLTSRAAWLGFSLGDLRAQLVFAVIATPAAFAAAVGIQLWLTRRRGALSVPSGPADAALQTAFYCVNGPLEEAFFRGLLQGGLGALWGAPVGFAIGTLTYVLYHRLGGWSWADTFATALVGVPLGLAFWLLPGPASLLGVSLPHIAATCGFLGPGPCILKRLNLL
jgi:membrane protease YdiL (CAAX protease family)